jgi:hypothetical protein
MARAEALDMTGATLSFSDTVRARRSTRDFQSTPLPELLIREVLETDVERHDADAQCSVGRIWFGLRARGPGGALYRQGNAQASA